MTLHLSVQKGALKVLLVYLCGRGDTMVMAVFPR